jgi:hypothetical protein
MLSAGLATLAHNPSRTVPLHALDGCVTDCMSLSLLCSMLCRETRSLQMVPAGRVDALLTPTGADLDVSADMCDTLAPVQFALVRNVPPSLCVHPPPPPLHAHTPVCVPCAAAFPRACTVDFPHQLPPPPPPPPHGDSASLPRSTNPHLSAPCLCCCHCPYGGCAWGRVLLAALCVQPVGRTRVGAGAVWSRCWRGDAPGSGRGARRARPGALCPPAAPRRACGHARVSELRRRAQLARRQVWV